MRRLIQALPAIWLAGLLGCGVVEMARSKTSTIVFPFAGLDRRTMFRTQPPYSTPDCMNVRPNSTYGRRLQGGSRPGFKKYSTASLGGLSVTPQVRMLGQVSYAAGDAGSETWYADFAPPLTQPIDQTTWWPDSAPTPLPLVGYSPGADGLLAEIEQGSPTPANASARRQPIDGMDITKPYVVTMTIWRPLATDGDYRLNTLLSPTGAIGTDGFRVALATGPNAGGITGASDTDHYRLKVNQFVNGSSVVAQEWVSDEFAIPTGDSFQMSWHYTPATRAYSVYVNGSLKRTGTLAAPLNTSWHQIGFAMRHAGGSYPHAIRNLSVSYMRTTAARSDTGRQILASVDGYLHVQGNDGAWNVCPSAVRLGSSRALMEAEMYQRFYIADSNEVLYDGTALLAGATITPSRALSATPYYYTDLACLVTYETGLAASYPVTASAGGLSLTLGQDSGYSGVVRATVYREPKYYDAQDGALKPWRATPGKGTVPPLCSIAVAWRNRVILAGCASSPNVWFMPRSGDPFDWLYSFEGDTEDAERPIASTSADYNTIGDPITAVVPASDDCVLFGCASKLWILRGDPGYGGQFDMISDRLGIVSRFAWCRRPEGSIVFLSKDGIYAMAPGGGYPQPISAEPLPNELRNINTASNEVFMAHSNTGRGIHIFISPKAGGAGSQWFLDDATQTFWPVSFGTNYPGFYDLLPTAMMEVEDRTGSPVLVVGCADGFLRTFDDTIWYDAEIGADETVPISSYVKIGPMRAWGEGQSGIVARMVATLSSTSGSVAWALYSADTPEAAVASTTPAASGTWTAGVNFMDYPRVAGAWYVLKLSSTNRWAMESIEVETQPTGLMRKL